MSRLIRVVKDVDVTRPNTPTGLDAVAQSETAIDLSWDAATDPQGGATEANSGIAGYRLYRDGVEIADQSGRTFSDTDLTVWTDYEYQVSAYDAAGNESVKSAIVTERTLDTTAPTAPVITASQVSSSAISVALIAASADDASGVSTYRLEYKRAVDSVWTVHSSVLTAAAFPVQIGSLTAGTSYNTRCRASDVAGNSGSYSATSTASTAAGGISWAQEPDIDFTEGVPSSYDLTDDITGTAAAFGVDSGTLPSGVTLTGSLNELVTYDGIGSPSTADVTFYVEDEEGVTAESDWQTRTSAAGVVWYHDFSSDSEITQFLWSLGYGDDPGRTRTHSTWLTRETSDGITGGGCLQILRPAGQSDPASWIRPLAALQDSGRGEPDSGWSSGMPTTTPVQGSGTRLINWLNSTDAGTYGDSKEGTWTGNEFYLQFRLKVDPRRIAEGDDGGKIVYLTTGTGTAIAQEMVTYYKGSSNFSIYQGLGLNSQGTAQGFQEILNANVLGDYDPLYPDEWVTYLYHLVVGSEWDDLNDDGSDVPTQITVWRARAGETSYTKIFERLDLPVDFQSGTTFAFNTFLLNGYHNGFTMGEFWVRYDQIIFSTQPIACPQV